MINIPKSEKKRVVIVGAGFAGLKLARSLHKANFQVVLIDKNNYHQFQPLLYQVATAGLEPSAIAFPLRKIFQSAKDMYIRITEVKSINTETKIMQTALGIVRYDYVIFAMGADTTFFGLKNIEKNSRPMKNVADALNLRNRFLQNFEDALSVPFCKDTEGYFNIVIVGGGPSGVEIAGAISEMKQFVLPKDFPEMDCSQIKIYLVENQPKLLSSMSEESSVHAEKFLRKMGVEIMTGNQVTDYDGVYAYLKGDIKIRTNNLIWTAGIVANKIEGLNPDSLAKNNRIIVDQFNRVKSYDDIFAIGDVALMTLDKYPRGHPQVAQVAIQQAHNLAQNLKCMEINKPLKPFEYHDLGSMATVGRNLAVVDFPFMRVQGIFAWYIWMFVHLMAIVGVKNKVMIFINWLWNYFTYDQSLRLILRQKSDNLSTNSN